MTLESSVYLVDDVTVLKVRGRIEGLDLEAWANALEVAELLGRGPILIDLDALEHWSVTAQSLLLVGARRAARRGRSLALCRPSGAVRATATVLRVFDRLTTYRDSQEAASQLHLPGGWTEPPSSAGSVTARPIFAPGVHRSASPG